MGGRSYNTRYDDLMARYGRPAPATGFAFNILALLKGLERQPDVEASTARDYLIFNLLPDRRAALEIATNARQEFPENEEVAMARAGIWDAFGFREEALFDLSKVQTENRLGAFTRLLYDTGRIHEAEKMSRVYGVRLPRRAEGERQWLMAPPAELTTSRNFPPPLTAEDMAAEAAKEKILSSNGASVIA